MASHSINDRLMRHFIMALALLSGMTTKAQTTIQVAKYFGNRQAAISYTFDDGLLEHYTKVFPRLKEHGIKATFCIIGSKIGGDHKGTPCMTWAQLREMAADGQEITSHGWQHKAVTSLSDADLRYEVQHNDTVIHDSVGVFPRTYFYPGNRKSKETTAFCMQDRVGTRLRQVDVGSRRDSLWLREWVQQLLDNGAWGITMTHGITIGYDAFKDPDILWNHFCQVDSLRDQIWIATFHDVSAYVKEQESICLETIDDNEWLEIIPHLDLDPQLFHHPLTLILPGGVSQVIQDGKILSIYMANNLHCVDFNPFGGKILIKKNFEMENEQMHNVGRNEVENK